MLDFIKKLQELEEKILSEFDEFKNFYRLMYKNDPKILDNLIFKVKYQVDQIRNDLFRYQEEEFNKVRENKCQNINAVIKQQALAFLKELKEKVIGEFYTFNNYNSGSDKIDNRNMDTFLLKIKYEIDKVKTDVLKEKNEDDSIGIENVENKKVEALMKLQTLAISIMNHIINLDNNL